MNKTYLTITNRDQFQSFTLLIVLQFVRVIVNVVYCNSTIIITSLCFASIFCFFSFYFIADVILIVSIRKYTKLYKILNEKRKEEEKKNQTLKLWSKHSDPNNDVSLVIAHVFRNEHSFHIEIALNYNSFLFHFFQTDSNKNVEDRHQCQQ